MLDLLDMHVLIQKSVQEHGNIASCCWCSGCKLLTNICCCCLLCCKSKNPPASSSSAPATGGGSRQATKDLASALDDGGSDIA